MAMTIGDLKAFIADQPDSAPVFVIGNDCIARTCLPVKHHNEVVGAIGHKLYLVSDEDPA